MTHQFRKLDDFHDEYEILLVASEEPKFGRVFNKALSNTHQLQFEERVVQDGETKRKAIVIAMKPFDYAEIRARTDDFAKLTQLELNTLVKRYALELKAERGRPEPGADRLAMIEALRAYTPPKPAVPPEIKPVLVIPPEILSLDLPNAVTFAVSKGVSVKGPAGKQCDLATIHQRIAKKLSEQTAAEPVKETVQA